MDLAVHSFNAALPPSRLIVPEGVSVNFVRRQIQYRVEVRLKTPAAPAGNVCDDAKPGGCPMSQVALQGSDRMIRCNPAGAF